LEIEIEKIKPSTTNPRQDLGDLSELAWSIKQRELKNKLGILQPIILKQVEDHYEVVIGSRRLAASKMAGKKVLKEKEYLIEEFDTEDAIVSGLVENIVRQDLTWYEEAIAFEKLRGKREAIQDKKTGRMIGAKIVDGLSIEEIAQKISKHPDYVSHRLSALEVAKKVKAYSSLPFSIALEVRGRTSEESEKIAEMIEREKLSREQVRRLNKKIDKIRELYEAIPNEKAKEKAEERIEPLILEKEMTIEIANNIIAQELGVYLPTPPVVKSLYPIIEKIYKFSEAFKENCEYKEWEEGSKLFFSFKVWIDREYLDKIMREKNNIKKE